MNKNNWEKEIKLNFNNAAKNYSNYSSIQKYFSLKIVALIKNLSFINGNWYDLGSGVGFLADKIEDQFPNQNVCRIDFCENMLFENKPNSEKILWDLNKGFPIKAKKSTLLVSNFCLHWLNEPKLILKQWFDSLEKGGYMIVCLPTSNSFPEWKSACNQSKIEYSGISFPELKNLLNNFKSNEIVTTKTYKYQENFKNIYKLLRNIINIGAHSTSSERKTTTELRKMQNFWPKNENNTVNLTWEIFIFILKKT